MQVALITGGNRGLGKSAALKLAEKKVNIILTYRSNEKEAFQTVKEIETFGVKAQALRLDLSDLESFPAFINQVKEAMVNGLHTDRFDFLLNNAGFGMKTGICDFKEEDFDELTNVHFKGPFFLTQALLPLMKDGGRILNVSSGLSRFSFPGYSVYGSLKGAMDVMTRYMAVELAPRKIVVNAIAPGAIATDFGGGEVRDNVEFNKMLASQTALGRVGEADDIGEIMAELLAGNTTWVNGQRIEATGGFLL